MTQQSGEGVLVKAPRGCTQPDGSAEGYRANGTLPLRVELARQLRRRRTRITLWFLAALPLLLVAAFQIGEPPSERGRTFADIATSSGLNFVVFTLAVSASFLLVMVVALVFGDTVASEASWSTLKYLLAAPIPRARLLRQKTLVAAMLSATGVVLLVGVATAVGLLEYGTGELTTPSGEALPFQAGLLSIAMAVGYLLVHLFWVAGLALWMSVNTDAPLGAVGGTVLVSILSRILDEITALGDLRAYLPTHYARAYLNFFSQEVNWSEVANGALSAVAYGTIFTALAVWRFTRKDITN